MIDYDVASNWGNWQYLAGVGCDPRGKRHFDLHKQAQMYDPEGAYVRTWGPTNDAPASTKTDWVDAADWPVE